MTARKPYRMLKIPNIVGLLNEAFAQMGLEVSDHFDPGNAYAPALVKFKNAKEISVNVILQFDRVWWGDGRTFEDAQVMLKRDGFTIAEVDVTALLHEQLPVPLTEYILDELITEGCGAS